MGELNQLVRWCLFAWHTNGMDPRQTSLVAHLWKWVALLSNFAVVAIAVAEIFLNFSGIETLANVETLPNSFLNFSKFVAVAYFRKEILDILEDLCKFWDLDRYGSYHKEKLESYHKTSLKFYKVYITICLITVSLLSFKPYIVNERILPFPGYDVCDLETSPCFEIHSSFQIYHIMCQLYPVIMGFDGMFFAVLTYVYVEVEQIKYGFQIVMCGEKYQDEELAMKELVEIVKQHNFLLEFVGKLNKFYSIVLFIKYWTSMGSMIFALFMMTRNGIPPDSDLLIRYGQYLMNLMMQLGMYCLGGNILMTQLLSISEDVFHAEWWTKKQPRIRKALPFIIQRIQRIPKMRIGKMNDLNLETYMNLLRHVVSIYTLLDKLST